MRRCNRGLEMGNEARYLDLVHDARIINDSMRRIRWSGRNLLNDARMAKRYPLVHNRRNWKKSVVAARSFKIC